MNEERMKILQMVSEGKITADEADKMLSALGANAEPHLPQSKKPRFLRVQVQSADGDNVDVRVPLRLIRAWMGLNKFMPGLKDKLSASGVDIDNLSGKSMEEIVESLEELQVNVNGNDKVKVYCE